MSPEKHVPIQGYWIRFNPVTHQGKLSLQMDKDPASDVEREGLSAEDVVALTAILTRGGAEYFADGSIGIRG